MPCRGTCTEAQEIGTWRRRALDAEGRNKELVKQLAFVHMRLQTLETSQRRALQDLGTLVEEQLHEL